MELSVYILNTTIILVNVVLVQVVGCLCSCEVESQYSPKNYIYCYSNGPNKWVVGPATMELFSMSVRDDLRIQTG